MPACLPVHSIDIIDHMEDLPVQKPAPTNTPILNRTSMLAITVIDTF
jgi:hypothetical protein